VHVVAVVCLTLLADLPVSLMIVRYTYESCRSQTKPSCLSIAAKGRCDVRRLLCMSMTSNYLNCPHL